MSSLVKRSENTKLAAAIEVMTLPYNASIELFSA
jgi:hypothetical protein